MGRSKLGYGSRLEQNIENKKLVMSHRVSGGLQQKGTKILKFKDLSTLHYVFNSRSFVFMRDMFYIYSLHKNNNHKILFHVCAQCKL